MTNREILNGMSNWDLADFLYGISGTYPPSWENKKSSASYAQWEQWLRKERAVMVTDKLVSDSDTAPITFESRRNFGK